MSCAPSLLVAAKAECKAALDRAKQADTIMAPILDRFYSETLMVVHRAPAAAACEMFRRMRILYNVIEDRTSWPLRIG